MNDTIEITCNHLSPECHPTLPGQVLTVFFTIPLGGIPKGVFVMKMPLVVFKNGQFECFGLDAGSELEGFVATIGNRSLPNPLMNKDQLDTLSGLPWG